MAFGPGRKLGLSMCKASAGSGSPNWAGDIREQRGSYGEDAFEPSDGQLLEESWESSTGWCWQEEQTQTGRRW